ncbi:Protein piwi [Orchesella cincta]|uniref:Protein piwi n=1 Tax=Orchesella cincta TaxID=48709 RepID=A0A1D2M6C6_ORCCI|nr:Protein piwi [Orchesella cincta]
MDLTSACGSTQRSSRSWSTGGWSWTEAGGAQGSHSRKGSRLVCKGNSPSGRQRRLYNGVQIPANAHQRELNNMGHHCTTTGFRWRGQPGPNNDQGGCSSQHGYWQSKTNNQGARCTKWKLPVGHGGCPKPEAQMIFVILPNNKAELYNVVKKRLAVDKGVLPQFQEVNGELPERIIMYRDGVGEGQLKAVYNIELTKLSEGLMKMYANGGRSPPLLTFIVVSKRVNTRLMMMKMNLQNPPPGNNC